MESKRRASSKPLVPGGNNYTAMHLSFQEQTIRVKLSFWLYFLAEMLGICGLPALVLPFLLYFHFDGDLLFLGIAILSAVIGGCLVFFAVRMVWTIRKRCRSVFDLAGQRFYPDGCALPERAIPLAELASLQIVEEHCTTGKNSFDSYELNVVLNDGRRFNLLDHGNKEYFAQDAEKLAQTLSLPLTDAQGKRLSCDTFLNLPVNIRENFLSGIGALLLFIILFATGHGHNWYLTWKSFHWERTPAWVESARIREHSGKRTTYSLDFHFRYRYQGKNFRGDHYDFFNLRTSQYTLEEIVRRYPAGRKFHCYVNPRSPKQAVVRRQIPPVWEMLLDSPWSCCCLIMGIFCLLKAATQYRLLKKRRRKLRQ